MELNTGLDFGGESLWMNVVYTLDWHLAAQSWCHVYHVGHWHIGLLNDDIESFSALGLWSTEHFKLIWPYHFPHS